MEKMLPYGHQTIDEADIAAVNEVLRSDWLTTGPAVERFEQAVGAYTGAAEAVAVSNGTAALHTALFALGVQPGDDVIVPTMTFAATANAARYLGANVVFVDVDPGTLLINPRAAEAAISPRTKVIIGVDYAGQPCDWVPLRHIAHKHNLALVADASHALGAENAGQRVGTLADITTLSFHPVKHIATGEGGMTLTNDPALARRMRMFRSHGIDSSARLREEAGQWFYAMEFLGYNYRLSDIQCALGYSQLQKLPQWLERRQNIAARYSAAFQNSSAQPLALREQVRHAWHLYVVRCKNRDAAFAQLRQAGIGVNVHYVPVHLHPYYQQNCGTKPGLCPVAEAAYAEILTLPLWPGMSDADVNRIITAVQHFC